MRRSHAIQNNNSTVFNNSKLPTDNSRSLDTGLLVALIGPSGSGKSALARLAKQMLPSLQIIPSYTTRPPRSQEDTDHVFIDDEGFDKLVKSNHFIGTTSAFGYRYGQVRIPEDRACLVLLRTFVLDEFKKKYPQVCVIAIEAPFSVIKTRLQKRHDLKRIDQSQIENEIQNGRKSADYIINTNQTLNESAKTLIQIIEKIP